VVTVVATWRELSALAAAARMALELMRAAAASADSSRQVATSVTTSSRVRVSRTWPYETGAPACERTWSAICSNSATNSS
jgi:hypothetical protein